MCADAPLITVVHESPSGRRDLHEQGHIRQDLVDEVVLNGVKRTAPLKKRTDSSRLAMRSPRPPSLPGKSV
jgi:hypothetical protein